MTVITKACVVYISLLKFAAARAKIILLKSTPWDLNNLDRPAWKGQNLFIFFFFITHVDVYYYVGLLFGVFFWGGGGFFCAQLQNVSRLIPFINFY